MYTNNNNKKLLNSTNSIDSNNTKCSKSMYNSNFSSLSGSSDLNKFKEDNNSENFANNNNNSYLINCLTLKHNPEYIPFIGDNYIILYISDNIDKKEINKSYYEFINKVRCKETILTNIKITKNNECFLSFYIKEMYDLQVVNQYELLFEVKSIDSGSLVYCKIILHPYIQVNSPFKSNFIKQFKDLLTEESNRKEYSENTKIRCVSVVNRSKKDLLNSILYINNESNKLKTLKIEIEGGGNYIGKPGTKFKVFKGQAYAYLKVLDFINDDNNKYFKSVIVIEVIKGFLLSSSYICTYEINYIDKNKSLLCLTQEFKQRLTPSELKYFKNSLIQVFSAYSK